MKTKIIRNKLYKVLSENHPRFTFIKSEDNKIDIYYIHNPITSRKLATLYINASLILKNKYYINLTPCSPHLNEKHMEVKFTMLNGFEYIMDY